MQIRKRPPKLGGTKEARISLSEAIGDGEGGSKFGVNQDGSSVIKSLRSGHSN